MSRIGVYGGSFNPPHIGHQVLCLMLLEAAPVDEVIVIPAYQHFFGKELAAFAHRVAMCERMIAPLGERIRVSTIEEELREHGGRMRKTLAELHERMPNEEFRLIIGADILSESHKWDGWDEVCALAPPLVFQRHGYEGGDFPTPPEVDSTALRKMLGEGRDGVGLLPHSVLGYIREQGLYR